MPNIFEIYVNGYRAYNEIIADGARETAKWADQYLGKRNTDILVNATVIDRGAVAAAQLLGKHPQAALLVGYLPAMKEFAKVGFAMVARGKSFADAIGDRAVSKALDQAFDSSLAPEVRAFFKSIITEIVRIGEAAANESRQT